MISLNHDSWLHLYGVFNGLYLAAFLFLMLFSFSVLYDQKQRYIVKVFFLLTLMFGCFGLYALYYQKTYNAVTVNAIAPFIFDIGKYTSPIALIILTYVVSQGVSAKSVRIVTLMHRYPFVMPMMIGFNLLCFVALFFIQSNLHANMLISIMFIPTILLGIVLLNIELDELGARILFTTLLTIALISDIIFIIEILPNNEDLHINQHILLHMFYGLTVVTISFAVIRYGIEEAKRFYDVKQADTKQVSNDILHGVSQNQFFMVYQPKLNLKTQKFMGLEGLIRWQHPTKGQISPMEFIPIAEKTLLIDNICRWTIEQAVIQARTNLENGVLLPVSINFSPVNLNMENVKHLSYCLEKHGLPADLIIIEITESTMVNMDRTVTKALNTLHNLGVKLSLDDYGTGFSSLKYITLLSLSELKIDKSFIRDISVNDNHRVIVESTLSMCHRLNLKVVAEGVENDDILDTLKSLNCDAVQGFSIKKPMTSDELATWISSDPDLFEKYQNTQAPNVVLPQVS